MKPRFALNLSHDGIGLMHRAKGGWDMVGEVALEDPDLTGALAALRDKAETLAPDALRSKLILPDSQILYFETTVSDDPRPARAQEVEQALEGRTPYALDEITYDFKVTDGVAQVAAVAQETLIEAEAFAVEHGFNPVSFVGAPQDGQFKGEPYFGPTQIAPELLPDGGNINRDRNPVPLDGNADAAPSRDAAPQQPAFNFEPAAQTPPPPPAAQTPDDQAPRPAEMSPLPPPEVRPSFSTTRNTGQAPKPVAAPTTEAPARLTLGAAQGGVSRALPDAQVTADHTLDAAPAARLVAQKETSAPANAAPKPAPKAEAKPARKKPALPNVTLPKVAVPKVAVPKVTIPKVAVPKVAVPNIKSAKEAAAKLPKPKLAKPKLSKPKLPTAKLPSLPRKAAPAPADATPPPQARVTAVAAPTAQPDEAEALTVFGARKAQSQPRGPRYLGLMLTVALVLVMAAVALWSALFMTNDVALLPEDQAEPAPVITAAPAPAPTTDPALPALLPLSQQDAEAIYAETGAWVLPPKAPSAPAPTVQEDLYVASIDPTIQSQDAVALPPAAGLNTDQPRPAEPATPRPGQRFDLDARGLVRPSPEGTLSPEGHKVFSGPPPLIPPARPQTDAALAPQIATPEQSAERARLAAFQPRPRPSDLAERQERAATGGFSREELAAIRPRPRPERAQSVTPEPTEPQTDPETAPQSEGTQGLARSVRPKARPSDFAKTVARAQESAAATPVAAVPASSRTAPSIPSTASVAKQATFKNGINLRDVNLIGVYGGSGDRRALVRLSSGRFVKVEVGDRLNGGKVSSIGDDSLTYVKSGRSHTLDMPDG